MEHFYEKNLKGKAYSCIFKCLFLFKGHILKEYKTSQVYIIPRGNRRASLNNHTCPCTVGLNGCEMRDTAVLRDFRIPNILASPLRVF